MKKHFGVHVAKAMLQYRTDEIASVLLSDKRHDRRLLEIAHLAKVSNIEVSRLPPAELTELSEGNKHQGVIVLSHARRRGIRPPNLATWLDGLSKRDLIIALEGIEDPRNLGACLRSANAAGTSGVILPRHRGCAITPTVSRTAAGAVETTPLYLASNLARSLDELKAHNYFIVGLDESAIESIYDVDFTDSSVLVFGAEECGLRAGTQKKCDQLARIPTPGRISSLNVSVAVGVVALEVARRRSGVHA